MPQQARPNTATGVIPISARALRGRSRTLGTPGMAGTGVPTRRTQKTARLLNLFAGPAPGPSVVGAAPPRPSPALPGRPPLNGLAALFTPLTGLGRRGRYSSLGGFADTAPVTTAAIKTGVTATGAIAAGSAWIPIIGPAVAAVTFGLSKLFGGRRGQQKLDATAIVEDAQRHMQANLDAYMSGPHTESSQAQAIANFNAAWDYIVVNCGNPELGDAGRRCVDERKPGGIYDFHRGYLNPIVEDPGVVPDPTVTEEAGAILASTGILPTTATGELDVGSMLPLLLGGGLLLFAFMRGK